MSVFCQKCGHRNVTDSYFCSSCGATLEVLGDRTVVIANFDPLQDALGPQDNASVNLSALPPNAASLVVRSGPQAGDRFDLTTRVTRLGRHPDSEISLDDISVSRRHAEIERQQTEYVLRDMGSMNGTYVNQRRVDSTVLAQGDEILIGRFRLIFLEPVGGE
jgi:pSer/pThr/pTyr-binding forkhead associated (FHA) protein/DNA-directed RNA polymerase subunit RPC12/RpoP